MEKTVFVENTKSGILIGLTGRYGSQTFTCFSVEQAKQIHKLLEDVLNEISLGNQGGINN